MEDFYQLFIYYILPIVFAFTYYLYHRKFSFFKIHEQIDSYNIRNKLPRGKCPPSYPNGWYVICKSKELKVGQSATIKMAGRNIAYFRGEDGVVYAIHPYCAHMGANLGVGGRVKHKHCIECPFHGWTFDGKTGTCVNGENYDPKEVNVYKYKNIEKMERNEKGEVLEKTQEGNTKLKTYFTKEYNGLVYVWFHSHIEEPYYSPPKVDYRNYHLRGESINYVNCHIQEIPENGSDIKHFDYVHTSVVNALFPYLKFKWTMKTKSPLDADFREKMSHWDLKTRAYQNQLFDQFLSDKDRLKFQYMNVLTLDAQLIILNRWKFFVMSVVGFQCGPATVTLFVKTLLFEAIFQQAIQPIEKFYLKVFHYVWTQSYLPYWLSAYILHGELRQIDQVLFDGKIWNQKIFSETLNYNMKSEPDRALKNWREWYSQFYEGCYEFEQKLDKLEW